MMLYCVYCFDEQGGMKIKIFSTVDGAMRHAEYFVENYKDEGVCDDEFDFNIYDKKNLFECDIQQLGNVMVFPVIVDEIIYE